MSIAEFPGPTAVRDDDLGQGRHAGPVPPQDEEAEQSVLGAMLLSKDAIADVVEVLRGVDFYRPSHELIYEAILDLYGRGEPVDAITVSAELTRAGDLARVGGGVYIHTLVAGVPVTANAGYYATIVREKAILRRLVTAGTKIVQLGYAAQGQVDDVVDRAQAEVYSVTDRRASEDYAPLSDLMELTIDELEAIGNRDGAMAGVPTGFAELDDLTNGLHAGQMVIVAARPAVGKALALDTPLPTPSGWTSMGAVAVGDELLGDDGRPTRVVAATQVMDARPCFEIEFSDGTTIVADAQHQWVTTTRAGRRARGLQQAGTARSWAEGCGRAGEPAAVVTTAQIADEVTDGEGRPNHAVDNAAPLQLPTAALGVPPYVLGLWLGAARSSPAARGVDVSGSRRIPAVYLRASERQRRALLAGLLDAAGSVTRSGGIQLRADESRLAHGVHELIAGLGYSCRVTSTQMASRTPVSGTAHVFDFRTSDHVFRMPAKAQLHLDLTGGADGGSARRHISAVRPVPSVPVRCVEVDNASHLYLAGRAMVPTHNSTIGLDIARSASIRHGLTSCIFSLEMSRTEITMRLLSAEARIPLNHMRNGKMSDDDWNKLVRKMGEVSEAPLFIDDSPNLTMMEIRAKARRLKQRHDLRLIIVDYLQLMTSGRKVESRQVEVSEFSRQIKLLAKELEVPVVAISQLNRGSEQRTSKRPLLSDLRESGCLTASTRLLRADTNDEITLGDLLAQRVTDIPVWSLDDRLRLVPSTLTHAFPSGHKPVFSMQLTSGRRVEATACHRFLSTDGWRPLSELAPGSRVATVTDVPASSIPRRSGSSGTGVLSRPWSRQGLALVTDALGAASLDTLATNDVRWDSIDAIVPIGERDVYDATVLGTHNFIANGVVAHNSLEQDADMVVLLHREDMYEKESSRPGEADLIVAKHRNGPTADLVLAFQGHYSRFVDMAQS